MALIGYKRSAGSPLSLEALLDSTMFHQSVFAGAEKTSFALQIPDQPFPMLSQSEHPTTGSPCWCIHPCSTTEALKELSEADDRVKTSSGRLLELWLLLIGNVVDLTQ